jgi:hypothetical protein
MFTATHLDEYRREMYLRRSLVLVAGLVLLSVPAFGQTGDAAAPAPPPPRARTLPPPGPAPRPHPYDEVQYVTPNRKLLWASGIVFAAGYVPAVVVAITSSDSADRYLYIPVAGPWVDLAMRNCTEPAGVSCTNSTLHGAGLFFGGLLQLAGLVGLVVAFRVPEARWIPAVHPAIFDGGAHGFVVTLQGEDRLGTLRW